MANKKNQPDWNSDVQIQTGGATQNDSLNTNVICAASSSRLFLTLAVGDIMKLCYCDESGTGDEPIAVMAGVIVDCQRMHKTKEHWCNLLKALSTIIDKDIAEFHTKDFYPGNGIWRGMTGEQRTNIILAILRWLKERKHSVIYSVIYKEIYYRFLEEGKIYDEINTLWRTLGLHLILGVQKEFQNKKYGGVKGNTIFIYDNEYREEKRFTTLLLNPPDWTDDFYSKKSRQDKLDQIVDVPYWGDSKEVGLIQLADFLAFFIRRYFEIKERVGKQPYSDEEIKINNYYNLIKDCSLPLSIMYPKRDTCELSKLFKELAPGSIYSFPLVPNVSLGTHS